MMTAIALCLHLYGLSTASGKGHPILNCREESATTAAFIGPDGHAARLLVVPPKVWGDAVVLLTKKDPGSTLAAYRNDAVHVLVLLHDPSPWVASWVDALGAGCMARTDLPVARAELEREKGNPAGVVDLVRLHTLGERVQADADVVASYRPALGADFPTAVCAAP